MAHANMAILYSLLQGLCIGLETLCFSPSSPRYFYFSCLLQHASIYCTPHAHFVSLILASLHLFYPSKLNFLLIFPLSSCFFHIFRLFLFFLHIFFPRVSLIDTIPSRGGGGKGHTVGIIKNAPLLKKMFETLLIFNNSLQSYFFSFFVSEGS
jgi:hypothetical protein